MVQRIGSKTRLVLPSPHSLARLHTLDFGHITNNTPIERTPQSQQMAQRIDGKTGLALPSGPIPEGKSNSSFTISVAQVSLEPN